MITKLIITALVLVTILPAQWDVDVVVYGGNSAGVIAAVNVIKLGKTVVIIEDHQHLGGMSSSGLGLTDRHGQEGAIKGAAREFYERLGAKYGTSIAWTHEPHVAEEVFDEMAAENNIPVFKGERLNLETGVNKNGLRIMDITLESGKNFKGKMFIDASYEGDLMAKSGVTYFVGRESESTYNEDLNGIRRGDIDRTGHYTQSFKDHFMVDVDPYIIPGNPASGIIPHVKDYGLHNGTGTLVPGTASPGTQAYNYRMCTSTDPNNQIPFTEPLGYDEKEFELLFRNFEAGDNRVPLKIDQIRPGKYDINTQHAFSTDGAGINWAFPEGDYATRDSILQRQKDYQLGLMWSLINHPRVPQSVRNVVGQHGLCKDEFVRNEGWPYEIYIREARKMVSDYVMTQNDVSDIVSAPDPIAEASFGMDSHVVQHFINEKGFVRGEGVTWRTPPRPYGISYRSIIPKRGEIENIFVPVCLSASHTAHGSIRMEPQFMMLGQAAAAAAVIAIEDDVIVQDVIYSKLITWIDDLKDGVVDSQFLRNGIVLDNKSTSGVLITGSWTSSTATSGFYASDYIHDNDQGKGGKIIRYSPELPEDGEYEVYLKWVSGSNRATNVPISISFKNGILDTTVNMQDNGETWNSLGIFNFNNGSSGYLAIGTSGTNGYVVADAVVFIPRPKVPVLSNPKMKKKSSAFSVVQIINGRVMGLSYSPGSHYEIYSLDGVRIKEFDIEIRPLLKDGLYLVRIQ